MKIKRIFAFLIDFLIVSVVSSLLFMLPVFKDNMKTYNETFNEYSDLLLKSGSGDIDQDKVNDLQYDISKASSPLMIIRVGVLFFYFGVLGFVLRGKTLGKKIFKLQVVSSDDGNLNPGLYLLREIIVTGIIFEIASLVILFLASKSVYLNSSIYISYGTYFVYFLLVGFVIFRDDERGLHDIICHTKVISTKEK